jgi:hypothetical protein
VTCSAHGESFVMFSSRRSGPNWHLRTSLLHITNFSSACSLPSPRPLPLFSILQVKTYAIIGGRSSEIPTIFRVVGGGPASIASACLSDGCSFPPRKTSSRFWRTPPLDLDHGFIELRALFDGSLVLPGRDTKGREIRGEGRS